MDLLFLNTVGPLLAGVGLASLGTVALAMGRRHLVWRLFAGFSFCLMAATLAAFTAVLSGTSGASGLAVRLIPGFALTSMVFAVWYIAEVEQLSVSRNLFGKECAFASGGPKTQLVVFGRVLGFRQYCVTLILFCAGVVAVMVLTDWAIREVTVNADGTILLERTPLSVAAFVVALSAFLKIEAFLIKGWRKSKDRARRTFTTLNFIGFSIGYAPGLLSNFGLMMMGRPIYPAVFLALPFAVVVFFVAIVRYQFAQIDELNRSLEEKVRLRTRALEDAQTRLVQAEKMGALGRLVAGVAHELNSPIGATLGMHQTLARAAEQMQTALTEVPAETQSRAKLEKLVGVYSEASNVISAGTQRVAEVVGRLRSFARLDEAALQLTDIGLGLGEAVEFVRPRLNGKTELQVNVAPLPPLRCDARALNQVWLNLLTNAVDAMDPDGGCITLEAKQRGGDVVISVTDSGRGMNGDALARAFDPGFTTKGVGVGTGLGLAICYQIVKDHRGTIELNSVLGAGTTVKVVLKCEDADQRSEPEAPKDASPSSARRAELEDTESAQGPWH